MTRDIERRHLARDAYSSWKKLVQEAETSIRVYTPYLDSLLVRLLANSGLPATSKSVATDLSPASGALNYRGQLIGVRALLRRGIEVRSLPRLHAKVLVCDGKRTTVGSQNFTSYARSSSETTTIPDERLEGSSFLRTLDQWFDAATPVDLDFIEELMNRLDDETRAAAESHGLLVAAFDRLWSSYEEAREAEVLKHARRDPIASSLGAALRTSRQRLARTEVWARLNEVSDWRVDPYETLMADRDSDFTRWGTRASDGSVTVTRLNRLSFYPLILNPMGRMGFGRIASTRITYVRESVVWRRPRTIAGDSFRLRTQLPREDVEESNIHLTLQPIRSPDRRGLLLRIRFDGTSASLSGYDILDDARFETTPIWFGQVNWDPEELGNRLDDPVALSAVLGDLFSPFSFTELQRDNHNAAGFFPRGWLRVGLVDFASRHVLVVSQT